MFIALSLISAENLTRHPGTSEYSDEVFECTKCHIDHLIGYIDATRPDLRDRLMSGDTVVVFAPQTDPPVIRVTHRSVRRPYFNLGEMWRWRILKIQSAYPFKKHQSVGVRWLYGRFAGLLADDMGLGKTLQAIAALERMQRSEEITNALVVCPKSLIGVWEAEFSLWAPRLCVVAMYKSIPAGEWAVVSSRCQVAITNYESLRTARPAERMFDLVIFDEIHKLKNPNSQIFSAAYCLNPKYSWGLSGTPIENHTGDLTAILHLLDRRRVSLSDRYLSRSSLRSLASTYILRRPRLVISDELPAVFEKTEVLPLSAAQKRAYDKMRTRAQSAKTIGAWIGVFNRLRDICDFDPDTKESAKIERLLSIVEAIHTIGEKVVVFSWKLAPLRLAYCRLSERHGSASLAMITGRMPSERRSRVVREFQTCGSPFVLLCSTRATSEGLTLTAANHVVFLNEWWNPAVNAQGRDRLNRIGQTREVFSYRLRSAGTVESRLDVLLTSKAELFQEVVARLADTSGESGDAVPHDYQFLTAS